MAKTSSTILITGGNRGIGLGFVKAYLLKGWTIFATHRHKSDELEKLRDSYPFLYPIEMEVSDPESVKKGFQMIEKKTLSLDLLINNAGRLEDPPMVHIEDDINHYEATMTFQTNVLGPLLVDHYALPLLKRGTGKKIIHITSGLGSISDNQSGSYYIYRMSKAALNMLNRNLSHDIKPWEITTTAICPGWVQTDMGGREAELTVEESVASMTNTIEGLTMKDSGNYIDRFGKVYPY